VQQVRPPNGLCFENIPKINTDLCYT
jgi:hypothetical protein